MKTRLQVLAVFAILWLSTGCAKHDEDPQPVYYYASAQLRGMTTNFKTQSSFSKFCLTTGVCNSFYKDPSVLNKNIITIGMPKTVKAGVTYTNDSSWTQISYIDDQSRIYFSSRYDSLTIKVTKWEGHGGMAEGTFSARVFLETSDPKLNDTISIRNGKFSAKIWYVIQ